MSGGKLDNVGLEKGSEVMSTPAASAANANLPPVTEAQDVPPVADGVGDRNMELCAWCGFMMHYGRGPVSHGICPSCREMFFPEVPNA